LVGAWGFEPQTPTVSRRRFTKRNLNDIGHFLLDCPHTRPIIRPICFQIKELRGVQVGSVQACLSLNWNCRTVQVLTKELAARSVRAIYQEMAYSRGLLTAVARNSGIVVPIIDGLFAATALKHNLSW